MIRIALIWAVYRPGNSHSVNLEAKDSVVHTGVAFRRSNGRDRFRCISPPDDGFQTSLEASGDRPTRETCGQQLSLRI